MEPWSILAFLLILAVTSRGLGHAAAPDAKSGGESFVFNGFTQENLTMDGAALVSSNGLLQLTNHTQRQKGYAFYPAPVRFKSGGSPLRLQSFSTTFVFAIVPTVKDILTGTHGMAFVVSPSLHVMNNTSEVRYLGIFNSTNNGNASNHIFAVEFDLILNPQDKDIDDNHIGIDLNSLTSVDAKTAGYYATEADGESRKLTNLTLPSGEPMQIWLEYDARTTTVDVTLAPLNFPGGVGGRPKTPLLSTKISNLSDVFLDNMYVGFAGATGKNLPVSQYVLGWSLQVGGGSAPLLNLGNLPKLPKIEVQSPKKLPTLLTIFLPVATAIAMLVAVAGAWLVWRKKKKFEEILEDWEIELYGPHRFSYRDLYMATKGFSGKELLGRGGFGEVYRGVMPTSGVEVAVKRVSHDSRQGIREFVAEIVSIGRLRHRNLVQLLGYCRRKGELLLVYDYMPNGSLDTLLFGDETGCGTHRVLDWNRRLHIIKGVGTALRYLHEEWEQVVIHRDVKSSNVLLDRDLNARLGDFGLARLYDHGTLPRTTHIVGTMGYIAPDFTREGKATEATDVFAFGVFLLEVMCGRRPIEPHAPRDQAVLVEWVLRSWMKGARLVEFLDPRLRAGEHYDAVEAEVVLKVGLLCSHALPASRPSMKQAMQILDGDLELPELTFDYWSGAIPSVETTGGFNDFLTRSSAFCSTTVITEAGDAFTSLASGR